MTQNQTVKGTKMNQATKERPRVTFAGFTFATIQHGERHLTVTVPTLRKLLRARAVCAHLAYDIEHDGNGQYDRYNQDIEKVAEWCDRQIEWLAATYHRPWLLYYDPQTETIHYCPHSNLAYQLHAAA